MKDRAHSNAKGGVTAVAVVPALASECRYSDGTAVRADRATVPTNGLQDSDTVILGVDNTLPLSRTTCSYRAHYNKRTIGLSLL
jgi:hypothetical protein